MQDLPAGQSEVLNLTVKLGPPLWHVDRLHVMPADFGPRLPPEGVEGVLVVSLSPSHPPHCVGATTCRRFWNMVLAVMWHQPEGRDHRPGRQQAARVAGDMLGFYCVLSFWPVMPGCSHHAEPCRP